MKKILKLFAISPLLMILSTLVGCNNGPVIDPSNSSYESGGDYSASDIPSTSEEEETIVIPSNLTIHYQMDIPSYDNKRFYLWAGGKNGEEFNKTDIDTFGMYIVCNPKEDWPKHDTFNFIIKNQGTWAGQSTDTLIPYKQFKADENGKLEVWCIDGEGGSIEVYATQAETEGDRLSYAKFSSWNTIKCKGTGDVQDYSLYMLTKEYYMTDPDLIGKALPKYLFQKGNPNSAEFDINLGITARPNVVYMLKVVFKNYPNKIKTKNVSFETLYDTNRFNEYYTYSGNDLGVTYTETRSEFRLWAPTSARVRLKVYFIGTPSSLDDNGTPDMDWYTGYEMAYTAGGVYYCSVEQNLDEYYYNFEVTNSEGTSEVVDPYAKATGINGARGEILDFKKTNPEGWDEMFDTPWDGRINDISSPSDLMVYEVHIRDLTLDSSWNGTEANRGTYKGFVESGTTYTAKKGITDNELTVKTGFDHIKELGINAVQILPFFDHDNDERKGDFNWGYNPKNYNAPEGSYSTNPYDGKTKVVELKEMILKLAQNNIRVIMDVVYNHVAAVSSHSFTKIVPKYYFRVNSEGYYQDGSGCGNEIKSEAPMVRKFIVDSVKHWATEYGIKGFRFDLMKLIDTTTMRQVKDAVYAIDHDNVTYGEGWALGYNGSLPGTDTAAVYSNLYPTETSPGIIGGFNDTGRNAMRGGNDGGWGSSSKYPTGGFIQSSSGAVFSDTASQAAAMLRGSNANSGSNPIQTVNYISCHDNYTAFDQLNYTIGPAIKNPDKSTEPNPLDIAKASVAAHAGVIFSQGISFIQGGEELFRSKVQDEEQTDYPVRPFPDYDPEGQTAEGKEPCTDDVRMYGRIISHNSYRSNDKVNSFKYDRLINITNKDGVKVDVSNYSEAFSRMINARKDLSRYNYPDNTSDTYCKLEGVGQGTTLLAMSVKQKDTKTGYVVIISGRNSNNTFQLSDTSTLLFNSFGGTNGYSISGSTISLSEFQILVFKRTT